MFLHYIILSLFKFVTIYNFRDGVVMKYKKEQCFKMKYFLEIFDMLVEKNNRTKKAYNNILVINKRHEAREL